MVGSDHGGRPTLPVPARRGDSWGMAGTDPEPTAHGRLLMETSPAGATAPYAARFESIGRQLPEHAVTSAAVMASTRHRTRIDLERLTGIHERRVAGDGDNSLTLATRAALDCLARSRHTAEELDVVVNCSITKYRDAEVQQLEPTQSQAVAEAIGATARRRSTCRTRARGC